MSEILFGKLVILLVANKRRMSVSDKINKQSLFTNTTTNTSDINHGTSRQNVANN